MSSHSLESPPPAATGYDSCLRQCDRCQIGASNAADPSAVTFIYRDPIKNIPAEIVDGAAECLQGSLNRQNLTTKRRRFGFSTSEDAVTWVVFAYLLRSGQLVRALKQCGVVMDSGSASEPSLLLWGSPVDASQPAMAIQARVVGLCDTVGEDRQSRSEPDVVIDLGNAGVIFVEVKYLSGNDSKPSDYPGWSRYMGKAGVFRDEAEVRASGCYELARNWRLLKGVAGDRPAILVNLGPKRLFVGPESERLQRFTDALVTDRSSRFIKLTWIQLLQEITDTPAWFDRFVDSRHLNAPLLPTR